MTTASTVATSTSHPRQFIRVLLAQQEISTRTVTLMHRPLFQQAGIEWVDGADLDVTLRAVSKSAAGRLIDAIRERT